MNESEQESSQTRRNVMKTVAVGAATITLPSFVNVTRAATASGNVELTTTSTQPTDTAIDVRINEDVDNDGTAENTQEETISAGTDVITEYAALNGTEGDGNDYWMEITLRTTDDQSTPELDTATITLPEDGNGTATPTEEEPEQIEPPDEPQGIGDLWNNYQAFVAAVVLGVTAIGIWSKSLAVGAFVGYLAFSYIAVTTGTVLFVNILYVTLVLVFIGFAFKLWRLEMGGE